VLVSVTASMNDKLLEAFEEGEVKQALFQMFPLKSLGSYGYPTQFFQKHWDLCGGEVTNALLCILKGEEVQRG
jgi:hypothetical protein